MRSELTMDLGGAEGGRLAGAFAAGCVACFAFCVGVGKWLWGMIGKVKDDQIAQLKAEAAEDRARCEAMEIRLVQRIQQLEGIILMTAPGNLRAEVQAALSETRITHDLSEIPPITPGA